MDLLGLAVTNIESYGYLAVILILVLGSMGLPLPEEPILLLCGYLASIHVFQIQFAILFTILGVILGDNLGYFVAKKKGLAFMLKYGEIFLVKHRHLKKSEKLFKNYGGIAVFLARFIVGFRFFGPILAGVSKMKWTRFFFYDLLGIIVWVPLMVFLGYLFGTNSEVILKGFEEVGHFVFAFILVLITFFLTKQLIREDL